MHNKRIKNKIVATSVVGVMVASNVGSVYAVSKDYSDDMGNKSTYTKEIINGAEIEDTLIEDLEKEAKDREAIEIKEREAMERAINAASKALVAAPNVLNYASSFAGGDGSQENPYQISTPEELARLAYLVNEDGLDTTGMYFELTDHIDLDGFDADNDSSNGNWIPIGYKLGSPNFETFAFKGIFNGNNYSISNMRIEGMEINAGLFGVVSNAEFRDVVLDSFSIVDVLYGSALACYSSGNLTIEGVSVSNFTFDYNSTSSNSITCGVLSAYVNNDAVSNSIIVDNVDVVNSSINIDINTTNSTRSDIAGGLLGSVYLNNDNIELTNSQVDIDITAGTVGGAIGYLSTSNLKGLSVNNVDVNLMAKDAVKLSKLGGIIGYTYAGVSNDSDLVVEDCNIIIDSDLKSPQLKRDNIGGVFGFVSGYGNNTNSIKCINVNVDFIKKFIGDYIGGIVGLSLVDFVLNVDDCSVKGDFAINAYGGGLAGRINNLNCNNFTYNGELEGRFVGNNTNIGGIVGGQFISDLNISNSNIQADIVGDVDYGGGICGYAILSNPAKVNNVVIEVNIVGKAVGGVVGYVSDSALTLDNITIGSEDAYAQISNNGERVGNTGVSAMIGYSNTDAITISNSNVYTNLDSKNTFGGGLIAVPNRGLITIDTVNIEGTLTGTAQLGGAIGYIFGGDVDISDLNIKADIDTYNGGYSSDTGGMIACVYTKGAISIKDSSYTGNIRGGANVGGVIGLSPVSEDTSTMDLSNIVVKADIENKMGVFTGGLIASTRYKNINMSNVIYEGNITTKGHIGGLIGSGIANIDGAKVVANIVNTNSGDTAGVIAAAENGNPNMVLSNLDIEVNIDARNSNGASAGAIGRNYGEGVIDNVTFNGSINGGGFCAGIVAGNYASSLTISNCDVTTDIDAKSISGGICAVNSRPDVIIEGNEARGSIKTVSICGGVAGNTSNVQIINNIVTMDIDSGGNGYNIGGIVGNAGGPQSVIIGNSFEGTLKGVENVGGICGVLTSDAIEVSKNISKANIVGQTNVGGMFGVVSSNTTAINNNAFIGSVEGADKVGGMIGKISSNMGTVEVFNSYTASTVNGQTDVNSVVGYMDTNSTLTTDKVYYDNILSPSDDIYGIGLSTDEMQGYPTYDNMDFDYDTIWFANKNYYPTFEQINTAPEIEAEDIEIEYGADFDPLDYIKATDFESSEDKLTINILQNTVKTDKQGNYIVEYEVVDEGGLTATKTINVVVKAPVTLPPIIVNKVPVINAKDIEIEKGSAFNPLDYVTATDAEDGDFAKSDIVVESNVNVDEIGVYTVTYSVEDRNGAKVSKTITVTVIEKDEVPPTNGGITPPNDNDTDDVIVPPTDEDNDVIPPTEGDGEEDELPPTDDDNDVTPPTGSEDEVPPTDNEDDVTPPINNNVVIITANDIVVEVGDDLDLLSGVKATDGDGYDITSKIEILDSNVDINKEGVYAVTYRVILDDEEYTKTINVEVKAKAITDNNSDSTTDTTDNSSNSTNEVVKTNDSIFLHLIAFVTSMVTSIGLVLFRKGRK